MTDCPMGTCVGCAYAKDCAHPETQARVLRAEVARLTGERDSAIEAYSRTLSLAATNGTLDAAETKARAEACRTNLERYAYKNEPALLAALRAGEAALASGTEANS